jgi:Na+-translocating ferredoxin:NAD+ oxidoreductase RnfD subunit
MSTAIPVAGGGRTLRIRGTEYPVVLPKLTDPRLHLATVFVCLHTIGQLQFNFRLSFPQILASLLTCGLIEVIVTFRRQQVLLWPASALLTGNGIAFIMRVPGTQHGDWWSLHGIWIYVAVAAVAMLSKYLIQFRGRHVFNPSNLALVLAFLILGSARTEPLEFWWGPTSPWLILVLGIIVAGALAILSRLHLLAIAACFWLTFAASIGVLAASGHAMSANWHIGPVTDGYFWKVLLFSPEVFIFLSFMITDPKTVPRTVVGRRVYAVSIGVLSALLIAPQQTEFAAKVGLLGSLTLVCAARPLLILLSEKATSSAGDSILGRSGHLLRRGHLRVRTVGLAGASAVALAGVTIAGLLVVAGIPARSNAGVVTAGSARGLPEVTVVATDRIASIDAGTASQIARDVVADLQEQRDALRRRDLAGVAVGADGAWLAGLRHEISATKGGPLAVPFVAVERIQLTLEPGVGQAAPTIVALLTGTVATTTYAGSPPKVVQRSVTMGFQRTLEVVLKHGRFVIVRDRAANVATPATEAPTASPSGPLPKGTAAFAGVHLTNVAKQTGLVFQQGAFHYGMSADTAAMMGGGLCWLDYDNDGWVDLFVVNSYADSNIPAWQEHGGLPTSALFHNVHGTFKDVSKGSGADLAVRGTGCVAADLNGDGHTDLFVTTAVNDQLLWNNGDGTFSEGTRSSGVVSFGWHSGAAVADVNGDGRPDLFVAGYTDVNAAIPSSMAGFPTNFKGVPDLLFLNEGLGSDGRSRFREVGRKLGLDSRVEHGLGAAFTDVNGDGRPDLYVANDEDPNRLYLNLPAPGELGFKLEERAKLQKVDDRNAGMGVAPADYNGDGRIDLFVTNSHHQKHAVFASQPARAGARLFASAQAAFTAALGPRVTVGWGASWVDLDNDGDPDLILTNGAIPVTNLKKDAQPLQVLQSLRVEHGLGTVENASGIITAGGLTPMIGRGLAAADYDNDGRVDVAINTIGGSLVLLRNTAAAGSIPSRNHWLEVSLSGFHPGAVVIAVLPGGKRLVGEVHAGSSYLSSEDARIHFGLGDATQVSRLVVRYPDGKQTRLENVPADQILTVNSGP